MPTPARPVVLAQAMHTRYIYTRHAVHVHALLKLWCYSFYSSSFNALMSFLRNYDVIYGWEMDQKGDKKYFVRMLFFPLSGMHIKFLPSL